MSYRDFTWAKVKQDFGLQTVEAGRFLPPTEPVVPTPLLKMELERKLPWPCPLAMKRLDPKPLSIQFCWICETC